MVWHNNTDNTVLYIIRCTTRCLPVSLRVSLCVPLRCVPRPGEAEERRRQAGKNVEKCGAGGGKSKKNRKSRKKVLKKFGNPAKSATFAVPFGKGASVPPPRIGGSSLNRKKEARAGPASPAPSGRCRQISGRCKERRRKSYYTMKSLILAQDER